eukprot:3445553-Pyramimonas_sp.AAC.1
MVALRKRTLLAQSQDVLRRSTRVCFQTGQLARNDLAPRALDTYPEAYSEFQKTMLLLLSVGDDTEEGPNLLAEELASGAREELAATLVTALRQSKEAYDPELSLLLRYIPEIAVLPP